VIFNDGDVTADVTTVIPGDLSEGEKEKIIQVPKNNTTHSNENTPNDHQPEEIPSEPPDSEAQNTVPFLTPPEVPDPIPSKPTGTTPDDELQLG
jgi:hypothetical protein